MFKARDYASIQFAPSVGAVISRATDEEEAKRGALPQNHHVLAAAVAYEWIRAELRQHESLWSIDALITSRSTYTKSRDDPFGQRSAQEEPALAVTFGRLADGARKYMLTFAGEVAEIATIEEVIERIKSLYARALVEGGP